MGATFSSLFSNYLRTIGIAWIGTKAREQIASSSSDSAKFTKKFELLYAKTHVPFHTGTYRQAVADLKAVQNGCALLVVFLHAPMRSSSVRLCQQTFSSAELGTFFDTMDGNLHCWAGDMSSSEDAWEAAKVASIQAFPAILIQSFVNGNLITLKSIFGFIETSHLIDEIKQTRAAVEPLWTEHQRARNEQASMRRLREEQDAAYQRSLEADQEKERIRQLQAEQDRIRAEQEQLEAEKEAELLRLIRNANEAARSRLPAEPEQSTPNIYLFSFQLPNGQRIQRRFNPADSLQTLYDFVTAQESTTKKFTLKTIHPVSTIAQDPAMAIPASGLVSHTKLYVEETEEPLVTLMGA